MPPVDIGPGAAFGIKPTSLRVKYLRQRRDEMDASIAEFDDSIAQMRAALFTTNVMRDSMLTARAAIVHEIDKADGWREAGAVDSWGFC